MFASILWMPMESYEAKKSKNTRGIVIGVFEVLGSFSEPRNPWTWRNYTFETNTWPRRGETIHLKLKLELCETWQFMHIIICTSDAIFHVDHLRVSSYNLMYCIEDHWMAKKGWEVKKIFCFKFLISQVNLRIEYR